jgi:hypothetical protein
MTTPVDTLMNTLTDTINDLNRTLGLLTNFDERYTALVNQHGIIIRPSTTTTGYDILIPRTVENPDLVRNQLTVIENLIKGTHDTFGSQFTTAFNTERLLLELDPTYQTRLRLIFETHNNLMRSYCRYLQ